MATLPNGWSYRATLTINHDRVVSTEVNFPVLLYWTGTQSTSNLPLDMFDTNNSSRVALATGADVRVSTDLLGLIECPIEIAKFATSAGGTGITAQIYTKLPSVSSSVDTVFYIWWHNPTAAAYATNATFGRNNVWTNGYLSVYHLEASNYTTSTANSQYDGTNSNAANVAAGFLGGDQTFNRTTSFVGCGDQDLTTGTWSAWVKADTVQNSYAKIINKSTTSGSPYCVYNLTATSATPKLWGVEISVGTTQYSAGKTAQLSSTAFQQILGRYNGGNVTCWIDGTQSSTRTDITGTIAVNNVVLNIGRSPFDTPSEWFSGQIDEVRIQSAIRSDGWITTEYNSMSSPQTFITQSNTPANFQGPVTVQTTRSGY
jgi:hypothetical protein